MSNPIPIPSKGKKPLPHEFLVMYRQRSQLTQLQLASLLGLKGERMVQLWEGGYYLPKAARLKKLIEVYLERAVFVSGQEHYEAWELWDTVKNLADANSLNFETYPIFDEGWFNALLQMQSQRKEPAFSRDGETALQITPSGERKPESQAVSGETASVSAGIFLSATSPAPNNLPAPTNPFIGRAQEIRAVCELVRQGDLRLVTLTGPGGIGKTRLALQVSSQLLESFKDGIWLVELAPHSDPRLVPELVAKALGLREEPYRSMSKVLADYLQFKDIVLLLDNCEHLLEECARFTGELLRTCPRLRILTTSREALGSESECLWRVKPLPVESPDRTSPQPLRVQSDAVSLFLVRARTIYPAFAPGSDEISLISQICTLLEGIPLAIELAAARVKILSLGQILERLTGAVEHRLGLLGGGNRYSLPRQQTLKASLDWSYNLLSEDERLLFRRLSVFASSWSLEAAEEVCGEGSETLENLVRLVDKSLVLVMVGWDQSGSGKWRANRYRMLEPVRQYAWLRLEEAGEIEATSQRHLDFFVKMAEEIEPESRAGGSGWLPKLEIEHPNIRAALEWALDGQARDTGTIPPNPDNLKDKVSSFENLTATQDRVQKAMRLASALNLFWNEGGHITEGREWLAKAAHASSDANEEQSLRIKAKALEVMGTLASLQGEYDTGLKWLEESLALHRELQDKCEVAGLLNALAGSAYMQGANRRACTYYEEALALYRELKDQPGIGFALTGLGASSTFLGKYEKAAACLKEALSHHQALGNQSSVSISLAELGFLAWTQGDLKTARQFLTEALAIRRELGNKLGAALTLGFLSIVAWSEGDHEQTIALIKEAQELLDDWRNSFKAGSFPLYLGLSYLDQDDYEQARVHLEESLALFKKTDDQRGMPLVLEGQAFLLSRLGKAERAAQLLGAAEGLRENAGYPVFPVLRERYQAERVCLIKQLGQEKFEQEWKRGRKSGSDFSLYLKFSFSER